MGKLYKRIDLLCHESNINITELCRATGITRSVLTELKQGRTQNLSAANTYKISDFFGVSADFLLGRPPFDCWDVINDNRSGFFYYVGISSEVLSVIFGIDKNHPENASLKNIIAFIDTCIKQVTIDEDANWVIQYNDSWGERAERTEFLPRGLSKVETKKYPMLGNIACGEPTLANEEMGLYVEAGTDIKADFCLRAKGDSMIGARIHDGDIVFIRQQEMVDDGEIAAVLIDDEATLKRVYYDRDAGTLSLFAENPLYKAMHFSGDTLNQIKIIGKAVAFQSDII